MWLIFDELAVVFFKLGTQKLKSKKWFLGLCCFMFAFIFLFLSFKWISS